MGSNAFAYHVSESRRRYEVNMETTRLAQLDALVAAGLTDIVCEYCDKHEDGFEPWVLIAFSPAACEAMGLRGEALVSLAAYLEFDPDRYPWLDGELPRNWYAAGKAAACDIEARFGERVNHPRHWKKERADAMRRLRTAKRALGAL